MYTYILLVDDHDEVAMYLPSAKKLVSTNQQANKSYWRSRFTQVSKLNHTVMDKKQADQIQFSLEKVNESSVNESSVLKCLSHNGEKTELRWDKKWVAICPR